ncbi:MAG: benzoate/H(+) symporter BenE family transporter [Rhodospirillales bacterium]
MLKDFSFQALTAGLIAAAVGCGGSFAIVIAGLTAAGASPGQAASGLMAAAMAMGFAGVVIALMTRMPAAAAWSTPGAALLVSTGAVEGGFAAAVGAFIVSGALIVLAGLWGPLGRAVARIPKPLAAAMLAGVLLGLCLAPLKALAVAPEAAAPVILVWLLAAQINRLWAVPAAAVAAVLVVIFTGAPVEIISPWPDPVFTAPVFNFAGVIGIALPLFIVTMASQNITGAAVLKTYGYNNFAPGRPIAVTGVFSVLAAPFGGHAVNLSAIVATLCAGPDAHADPARRYWAAVSMGVFSVLFGLSAALIAAVVKAAPPLLIETVAGLALLGPLAAALKSALDDEDAREAAVITFATAASGLVFLGVAAAFWGLIAGGLALALKRAFRRSS